MRVMLSRRVQLPLPRSADRIPIAESARLFQGEKCRPYKPGQFFAGEAEDRTGRRKTENETWRSSGHAGPRRNFRRTRLFSERRGFYAAAHPDWKFHSVHGRHWKAPYAGLPG